MGEGVWIGWAIEEQLSHTRLQRRALAALGTAAWALSGMEPVSMPFTCNSRWRESHYCGQATIRLVEPGEAPPTPTLLPELTGGDSLPSSEAPLPETEGEPQPSSEVGTESPSPQMGTPALTLSPEFLEPLPTWTPLVDLELPATEAKPSNWPVIAGFILQGVALLLGAAAFLRRR